MYYWRREGRLYKIAIVILSLNNKMSDLFPITLIKKKKKKVFYIKHLCMNVSSTIDISIKLNFASKATKHKYSAQITF